MAIGMRHSTEQRNAKRQKQQRELMQHPDVSLQEFVDLKLYASQQGLYAYLGFPLKLEALDTRSIGGTATDWAISPERVDDDVRYTISILLLVMRQVNLYGPGLRKDQPLKWSKAKADELFAQAEQARSYITLPA